MMLVVMVVGQDAWSKRIYSYVDENGIKHFTDKKPDTDQPVTAKLVKDVENGKMVTMRTDEREPISNDCETCHVVLADEEESPDILATLDGE